MITRIEFYAGIAIIAGILIFSIWSTDNSVLEIQKARIETKDSMLRVQKDSAFARALQYELKADSLQATINRKKLDLKIIQNKYENEKRNVLVLGADSTLSLFERTIAH